MVFQGREKAVSVKVLEGGMLRVRGQRVKKGNKKCDGEHRAHLDIVVRATIPEVSHPAISPASSGASEALGAWPALVGSNAYSRGGWTEGLPSPKSRQDSPLDVVTWQM